jgi:hypothetical protein
MPLAALTPSRENPQCTGMRAGLAMVGFSAGIGAIGVGLVATASRNPLCLVGFDSTT